MNLYIVPEWWRELPKKVDSDHIFARCISAFSVWLSPLYFSEFHRTCRKYFCPMSKIRLSDYTKLPICHCYSWWFRNAATITTWDIQKPLKHNNVRKLSYLYTAQLHRNHSWNHGKVWMDGPEKRRVRNSALAVVFVAATSRKWIKS